MRTIVDMVPATDTVMGKPALVDNR
jgi:hypothetical protein